MSSFLYLILFSSNGTFINKKKIGKGQKNVLANGNELSLVVPSAAVTDKDFVNSMHS